MKLSIKAGATSESVLVFIQDSASTTGAGKTGLVYTGITAYYSFAGANATATAITMATQTVTGAYASGGFVEISSANMPGVYRFDLPNAVLASSKGRSVVVYLTATGAAPCVLEIELTGWDNQDATAGGISRLDAAVTSRMATFTLPTNFSSMAITAGGAVTAGTVSDKTGYSLTQTFPTNFSALAITAGGAVTAGTVSDKTGYSISGTKTTLDALNDIAAGAAMTLTSAYDFAKGTVAMTESYAANGVAPTPVQALFAIHQDLMDFSISGTSYTVKKLDKTTTAFTVTLDSSTSPTSATR